MASIAVKEAVRLAGQYFNELFSDEKIEDLGLEGAERDGPNWVVTLGFSRPWSAGELSKGPLSPLMPKQPVTPRREYKEIRVKALNGEFVSVRTHGPRN